MRAVSDSPAAMASYFDEHDCEPLDPEPDARTNMLRGLAGWRQGLGRGGGVCGAGCGGEGGWGRRLTWGSGFRGGLLNHLQS